MAEYGREAFYHADFFSLIYLCYSLSFSVGVAALVVLAVELVDRS